MGTALANNFSRADTDGNGGLSRAESWNRQFGGSQVPPDIYYSEHAKIILGGKTVELHNTGRNHTDDMTVILFPEERVVYTVDFLTPKRLPRTQLHGGFITDWVKSLRQVEELDFDVISPGHALPGTKEDVTGHVLSKASPADTQSIAACIDAALDVLPLLVEGEWQKAMKEFHTFNQKDLILI